MSWLSRLFGKEDRENTNNEITDKLLADRIIFLGTPIDDAVAQTVIAQMLFLEHESPNADINFYLNSLGGSITASFAIYDPIKSIKPDVTTICTGQCAGTASILLAAGTKGKRFIQPSSRVIIYKPKIPSQTGQNPRTAQKELARTRELIMKTIADETNLHPEQVSELMRNDTILSAQEAIGFGFADEILRK